MIHNLKTIKNGIYMTLCCMFLLMPFITHAQFGDDFSLVVNPALPGPYEEVELIVKSFSANLNRSEIFWYIDDEFEVKGVGLRKFSFTTGSLGSTSQIDVVAKLKGGGRLARTLTIRPAEVDVLWRAHTYTPPFYNGRALPTSESLIKIVALPHFVTKNKNKLNPSRMVYMWEQDGVVLGSLSGLGKDYVVLRAPTITRARTFISVSVESFDGTMKAQKTISVRTSSPKILFYEKHPLLGIRYEQALQETFTLAKEEVTLRAEPYFFSLDDIQNEAMEYRWTLNNRKVSPISGNSQEITLRQQKGVQGIARLGLKIENISKLLQLASKKITIQFGL